jgi:hypothetical protein
MHDELEKDMEGISRDIGIWLKGLRRALVRITVFPVYIKK